jgi:acetoin utilization protein AcuC
MAGHVRVVWSPALLGYDFGVIHPMAPERLALTMRLAEDLGLLDRPGVEVVGAEPVDDATLATVHTPEYIRAVRAASDDGVSDPARGLGTEDDPVFAGMHEAAARIVAGTLDAARAVWSGEVEHAVNIAGGMHHAMPGAASGFCAYNDAAVAIHALLAEGAERVAYVDLDAHHGDGVQAVFYDDPRVLTVSVHESGITLFPGTGPAGDAGLGAAAGTVVNLSLPARTTDAGWLRAVDAVVPAVVREFRPDIVVSQHGCDAHGSDPLSNLDISVDAQRLAASWVHDLAHEVAGGRWVALGGGGYAVVDVVPRAWAHVIAIATHEPIDPHTPVPAAWREHVKERWGRTAPPFMSDGAPASFRPWTSGYDPADALDRAVRATRQAVFPLLGLHVDHD